MRHTGMVAMLAACVLAALGAAGRSTGAPGDAPAGRRASAGARTAFQLFPASSSYLALDVNRVRCFVDDVGQLCSASDIVGGGYWPKGTPDQYIYNGGLQVAAIIPQGSSAFRWAGDTVGSFFFDPAGFYRSSSAIAGIYDSRSATDLANWPSAAYVRDTTLFDASLIGLKAASEQDSWVRYWDGAVNGRARAHSMGVLVDQRTLAWNRPEAGRDILFVLYRLINVTARDRSRYAGLADAGYTPGDIDEIARIGADYHARSDTAGVNLPDTGFTWMHLYVGVGQDPDVTSGGGSNYSTAVLPFATTVAYLANFSGASAGTWTYPPDVYRPPFAVAPGLAGTTMLRAANGPVTGTSTVSMFTNFTGGGPFPGPTNVRALWRMLANHIPATDGNCNAPVGTPLCEMVQAPADTRWSLGTGPWADVGGGQSVSFVIAYVFAAPLAAPLAVDAYGHSLGNSLFDLKPGFPATGTRLAAGTDTVRQIERVAGWRSFVDANGNGDVEGSEVQVEPYSLLGKAATAQLIADNKFVFTSPPAAPRFYVLPGDGQATVVWERSASEVAGDPYFAVAANPLSALYDSNFRQNDVEGYRVWRGRSLSSMQMVAQFDYAGTAITDHTGQIYPDYQPPTCAPEFAVVSGCGADFLHGGSVRVPLSGTVVQVPMGGRTLLASGAILVLRADTVGGRGAPLQDTRVPFAFVDTGLQDGTTYVYAVTAFDVNSVNSGPASLESALVARTVTPRIASSNAQGAIVATRIDGGDGSPLDTAAAFPAIDPNTGTFSGPIPPSNGGSLSLQGLVQELLPAGTFTLVLDSVGPGFADATLGADKPLAWFSVLGASATTRGSAPIGVSFIFGGGGIPQTYVYQGPLVPYDSMQARRFGVQLSPASRMIAQFNGSPIGLESSSPGVGRAAFNSAATVASGFLSHSRWFDEGGQEPPDPTITPFASASHTNGALTGVSAIYSPLPYRVPSTAGTGLGIPRAYRVLLSAALTAWHPADFVVRWGAAGAVTVTDLTHRTAVPYKAAIQPGYGFLNASALVAAGVTSAQLNDGSTGVTFDPAVVSYYSLRTIAPVCTSALAAPCVPLAQTAELEPVDVNSDGVSDGSGIALVLDGEPFFFLTAALPAAGTAWHLRAVGGAGMTATCAPALPGYGADMLPGSAPADCAGYTFTAPATRPAYVPGLRYTVVVTRQFGADTAAAATDLARVHTVPDPFYFTGATSGGTSPSIRFVNLPERAIIRIYSASGILVTVLTHNDATAGGEEVWDVSNRSGHHVASGVYFYHVETPDHRTKIGRLTVVQQFSP